MHLWRGKGPPGKGEEAPYVYSKLCKRCGNTLLPQRRAMRDRSWSQQGAQVLGCSKVVWSKVLLRHAQLGLCAQVQILSEKPICAQMQE